MANTEDKEDKKKEKRREQQARSKRVCRDRQRKSIQTIQKVFHSNESRIGALYERIGNVVSFLEAGPPSQSATVGSSRPFQYQLGQSHVAGASNNLEEHQKHSTKNCAEESSRLPDQVVRKDKTSDKNKNRDGHRDSGNK